MRHGLIPVRSVVTLCLTSLASITSPLSQAQEQARSAGKAAVVAPLHVGTDKSEDKQLGEAIGEVLAIALADQKQMVVVERRKLAKLLEEQKLALSGLVDPATAARVGKLLTADVVVAGSIVELAGKLRAVVYVVAVDGQRVLGQVQVEGTRKEFDRAVWELSGKVAALAGVKLPEFKPEELDDSPVGRLHLMRGISFYYANNHDQAIVYCLRAVQLDPRLQEARLWIAKSYLAQGEKEHARAELKRLAQNPAAKHLAEEVQRLLSQCETTRAE